MKYIYNINIYIALFFKNNYYLETNFTKFTIRKMSILEIEYCFIILPIFRF